VEVEVGVDVVDALADTTPDPSGPAPGVAGIDAAAEVPKVGEEEGVDLVEAA
jgi:NADPH:quinone reductase-like Zn-dependent oxidoreductase